MNRRRLIDALHEVIAALEDDEPANDAHRDVKPAKPPRPAPRPPTDVDRERARRNLERLGYRVKP